jgi:radical SAM protein with 4Fe4S-binding SPASM domain
MRCTLPVARGGTEGNRPMHLRELKIELIQQCTLACVHCSTDSHRRRTKALPEEVVFRLIQEAPSLGVEKIAFSGGEPLLVPYLVDAIKAASGRGIHTSLYTCGVVDFELNPLSMELARRLAAAGLGRFIFSVYSHRPEIHNSITRYASFSTTVSSLMNAVAAGAPAEIHCVAMRRNFRDLPGLVSAAREWGVKRVSVLRFVPHGRGTNIAERDDLGTNEMRELRDIILAARSVFPEVNVRTGSPYNTLGVGYAECDAAQSVLSINYRGEIFPCDAFKNVTYADNRFGSVLDCSLREVWQKSAFLNRVRDDLSHAPTPACGSCAEFSGCRSGCLAQKVIRDGWEGESDTNFSTTVRIGGSPQLRPELGTQAHSLVQIR